MKNQGVPKRFVAFVIGILLTTGLLLLWLVDARAVTLPGVPWTSQPSQPVRPEGALPAAIGLPGLANLNIPFVANDGQLSDSAVRFYATTFAGTVYVTADGVLVYALPSHMGQAVDNPGHKLQPGAARDELSTAGLLVLRETLLGASLVAPVGENMAPTKISSFRGQDPARWRSGLPTWKSVNLGDVYPGIALQIQAHGHNVEKIFTVNPGADPEAIMIQVEGIQNLSLAPTGELIAQGARGEARFTRPSAYQEINGLRMAVPVAYWVQGDQYGFVASDYDDTLPLVIDPLLASTYLGGSSTEHGYDMVMDALGNLYLVGYTCSPDFPTTPGTYDPDFPTSIMNEVFIAKMDSSLGILLAGTFLGGTLPAASLGYAIALDTAGNVYVAGNTRAGDFPVTATAFCTNYHGDEGAGYGGEGFISRFDSGLTNLLASTYLGGNGRDECNALAINLDGQVCVAGSTFSANFPVTPGAYDTNFSVTPLWSGEGFICTLNASLTNVIAATYLGPTAYYAGYHNTYLTALQLDPLGSIYVAGYTLATNFPTTPGAYRTSFNTNYYGGDNFYNGIVTKLPGNLTNLLASTFLGGMGADYPQQLARDNSGAIYIAGYTYGWDDFPCTARYGETGGNGDAFVCRMDALLTALPASAIIGGSSSDNAYALALDSSTNVYIAGDTASLYSPTGSRNFPVTPGAYDTGYHTYDSANLWTDGFITKLNWDFTSLLASTLIGGFSNDTCTALALGAQGEVYVLGDTASHDFPMRNGYQQAFAGGECDMFVAKLDKDLSSDQSTDAPAAPTAVAASQGAYTNKVRVSWTAPAYATYYEVWRNTVDVSNVAGKMVNVTDTSWDDTSVVAGTTYYYWIAARNAYGSSPLSAGASGYCRYPTVEGDFDGDRLADPYWPVKNNIPGMWTLWLSSGGYLPWGPYIFSVPGGEPVRVADFDDDGLADPVMVANGGWTFWFSSGGYLPSGPYIFAVPGGEPVAGDFDGDGSADPAMVANGGWTLWLSSGGYLPWGPYIFSVPGGEPLAGDIDGDCLADPVMVVNGAWTLWLSSGGYLPWGPYIFSVPGTDVMPMLGDFDGDGLSDPTMVVNNNWTFWFSSGGYQPWGPYTFVP